MADSNASATPEEAKYVQLAYKKAGTQAEQDLFQDTLDGVALHTTTAIAANATVYIDLKQVLATTKIIAGLASATSINFHISGVEIA